ncbi:macro domain-containing protein [bacterium]|nr:macro domain-containing protein [bacterium]
MNEVIRKAEIGPGRLVELVLGDITREEVDAIVNAANSQLQHGGGVAAAISRAGGPEIQAESDNVQPVPVGDAKATGAGKLPCKKVIHAVGPRWGEGDEDAKLSSAIRSSLELAGDLGLTSISLPAISSGIFGFPLDRASRIIMASIRDLLQSSAAPSLQMVRVCIFDQQTLRAFEDVWNTLDQ